FPAFPLAFWGQADNPRRLVVHHDDSVVRSCAYPYTTLLGGMRWWIPRDRLSRPLHNVDGQSQSWGVCIILASRREELHLYSLQGIKDRAVSTHHPSFRGHFEGTDRRDPLNVGSSRVRWDKRVLSRLQRMQPGRMVRKQPPLLPPMGSGSSAARVLACRRVLRAGDEDHL